MFVNYLSIFKDILVDLVSMYIFAYLILYRRYGNKELFVTCTLFNVSLMLVVMAIVRTDFNLAVGFGLFALLSLITVRSAPFSMTEMAHFFAGIALAVVNGSGITDFAFILMCNIVIVGSAWIISSWATALPANIGLRKPINSLTVLLEYIDKDATSQPAAMREKLADKYNLNILSYKVLAIDHVRNSMKLEIVYSSDPQGLAGPITEQIDDTTPSK